jgi:hypothetical protein
MKINHFILIVPLFVINTISAKDTLNMIEIGRVFTSLFNNAGLKYGYDLNNTTFAYTRIAKSRKVFFKAEYHYYKQYNQYNINLYKTRQPNNLTIQQGDDLSTQYNHAKIAFGANIKLKNQLFFMPYIGVNYRWGIGEEIYWYLKRSATPNNKPFTAISNYKNNIGLSIGFSLNYILKKRYVLGLDNSFNIYRNKVNLTQNNQDKSFTFDNYYKPNTRALMLNFKAGYLF